MKNLFVNENQKKEILNLHEELKKKVMKSLNKDNHKNFINEQAEPIFIDNRTLKQVMKDCVKPGVKAIRTTFKSKPAIKVDGGPDNIKIYTNEINTQFGGYNKYVLNSEETKIVKQDTWSCPVKKVQSQEDITNIQRTKEQGGWKERKEIEDTNENVENPQMYDKITVSGVALYRSKPGAGVEKGSGKAQSIIDDWKQKGYKLKSELSPSELNTWKPKVASPKSEGYFNQDLIMYYDPTQVKGATSNDFETITTNQSIDRDNCKKNIEAYWDAYKKKIKVDPATLNSKKEVIQACRDQHRGKWGVLGAGKKWDSIVDLLSNRLQSYDGFKAPKNTNQSNWSLD